MIVYLDTNCVIYSDVVAESHREDRPAPRGRS